MPRAQPYMGVFLGHMMMSRGDTTFEELRDNLIFIFRVLGRTPY